MTTYIALLRGINVNGKNLMPMKDLRALLDSLGFTNVRTYIQSGNCIFNSEQQDEASIANQIADAIEAQFSFKVPVMVLSKTAFEAALADNPFPQSLDAPKTLHLFFLASPAPEADLDAMAALATETEQFELKDQVFYLYTPDGFGRSKLAAKAEKLLGVASTARNLNSTLKILKLAEQSPS